MDVLLARILNESKFSVMENRVQRIVGPAHNTNMNASMKDEHELEISVGKVRKCLEMKMKTGLWW